MPSPHGHRPDEIAASTDAFTCLRATHTTADRLSLFSSILVAIASATIAWNSAKHLDMLWDEQVDHDIAAALAAHAITGGDQTLDASQLRLPMYLCAAAFKLTNSDDLAVARAVSVVLGAITIIAAAGVARICFGPLVAILASLLLAFAPYFLAFERISMTEGDVAPACFMTLSLWFFLRYQREPTARRWLVAAIFLGLAVGAKVFAGVLIFVFAIMVKSSVMRGAPSTTDRSPNVRRLHQLLALGLVLVAATAAVAIRSRSLAVLGWVALFILWVSTIVFVCRRRPVSTDPYARFIALLVLAVLTFFAVMPVHLTDHQIVRDLARRMFHWGDAPSAISWRDHLRLYSGILLIKLTIPFGILTCLALVYAAIRERKDPRWRPFIYCFVFYVVGVCLLPLRQTFYLMGVYPLVNVITAAFVVEMGMRVKRLSPIAPSLWSLLILILLCHLGIRVANAYPSYNLYGYDRVGDRWLGAESRGYRNLIQTPSDGVAELIHWCNTDPHVHRGDRVVSYLWEDRIIDQLMPRNPHFELIRRGIPPDSFAVPPAPSINGADYVLVHINNLLGYGDLPPDWPPGDILSRRFEAIYTVRRGPLAVAWVYGRRN